MRCVVAENVAVPGGVVGCGVPSLWQQQQPAADPAPVIRKLLNLGAAITGQGSTQPCNYPTLGANIRNPVGRFRVAGGGASGAAAAVAVGDADVAVCTDFLGSLRIPAACMGLCGVVYTPGTLGPADPSAAARISDSNGKSGAVAAGDATPGSARSSDSSSGIGAAAGAGSWRSSRSGSGSSSGGGGEPLGFVAAEVGQLCRVSSCLGVPGAANLRHEVTQVVVAEDLFQLCEVEMSPGILAVKRAVLVWAGNEQAGSVQLMQFLEANTHNWRRLQLPEAPQSGPQLPPVLRAITRAAQLLYHSDLAQRYLPAVQEAVAAAANTAADQPDGDEQQQQQLQQVLGELDPMVLDALRSGAAVTQAELKVAQDIAKEVQDVLKGAVKKDVVVVAPCVPSAPPRLDAPAAVQQAWLARAHAFAAITALGGCPCVVLPVGKLPDGAPLGLCMFGQSRTDQRLLAVADKLMPHVQEELAKIRQQAAAETAAEAAAKAGSAAGKGKAGAKGAAAAGRRSSQDIQVDAKRAERAEKAKARGNEAFKAGRFMEAIKAYSEALKLHPGHPVYANNRAMAYLKVFRWHGAVGPCLGRFMEAIKAYSEALKLHPGHPVYANNRAMAYLKVFRWAIKAYSEALKLHPGHPVHANNRAMAYLKVFSFEAAEADCNRALASPQLAPQDRVKALLRRGTARMHKGDLRAARSDFREVLSAEPNNRQAREELKALQQQEQDMEQTRRQHALAAAAAAANSGSGAALPGLPPQLADLDPATAAQLLASGELGDFDPRAMQAAAAAAAAASGMGGGGGYGEMPGGYNAPGAPGGGLGGGLMDGAGSEEEQLAEMLRSGGMSVVLGQNGQAVSGPRGEPVIVGPDGRELTIEPTGKLRPYKARRAGAV
ncbi:hypothetical protein OEZ85_014143 [Tetradesmus obliquus]|uniref:Amidase domain-containing protein n=1 Tax=Tetradesmus obliquus TaxID=3088 RepID=A0ABY8U747_TETOB|nr:hypothetical protein OEZ85_014143 [Tetradesmus obliquus]